MYAKGAAEEVAGVPPGVAALPVAEATAGLLEQERAGGEDLKAYTRLMDDGEFEIAELERKGL
ncbi:MAG TPA: hypothetical protein VJ483_01370 [Holophagaceae bacterium]|nr:hypothetical protein [Holophagaceae bacterium]